MSSYVENVLSREEKINYQAKISLWSLAPLIIWGIIVLVLSPNDNFRGIGLIFFIIAFIRYKTTELAVTNKKVIAKSGFVKRRTIELLLNKVESVQVHQSVFGRMLNYGSVIVSGAGTPQAPIRGISYPIEFRKQFMEIQEEANK
ncbi:MAG: PH domain-containing protein [Deltaproteobacteria bacterium]|nr:PH domain-containing protein [Deltaproteobacteria bacterium]